MIEEGIVIGKRRVKAMSALDDMTPETRQLVYEFGVGIVEACRQAGVTRPAKIRELVYEIWGGARQLSQRRGARGTLDWLLIQAGAQINAKTLIGLIEDNNMVLVSCEPTREMLDASMSAVTGYNVRCTREEKHRRRLRAALRAASVKNQV